MQARFLLGPAGSGKTFRCLAEVRRELLRSPDGPPLLLLAPKQATFQLERQLLADSALHGYTRLQILSFDRLAQFLLTGLNPAVSDGLDDEGRVMVLRALLAQKRSELRLFHATARLPGFATRLSLLLRELQRHQISSDRLLSLADKITGPATLRDKLHDFGLILRAYLDWLEAHRLQDANCLLDLAVDSLHATKTPLHIAGLWLDGFAELTAQELELLAAILPCCDRATLAFCLPTELHEEPSWLSPWAVIGQTYLRCRQRISDLPDARIEVDALVRSPRNSRFKSSELARLEQCWSQPGPVTAFNSANLDTSSLPLRLFACANPEAEATLAAREIRRFVREGGRYRETAVLVRSLDHCADTIRRIFDRYEIPCFLDRREPVAHHPLAELTRCALRTVTFGWRPADWFGALKTGLGPAREEEIDWLENTALEFGWNGNVWQQPFALPDNPPLAERAERLRRKLVPPFAALAQQTAAPLNGIQLAAALRELWNELGIEETLGAWSIAAEKLVIGNRHPAVHATVLEQMNRWLGNLERAFPSESLPLRDWLPILEAGLANLTVGVVPPALDQVLVGAIDRSRNPDLKLALVLGLNEGVFPARPAEDPLLTELERDTMNLTGARLGPSTRPRLGHEWFYGYIACTRASERLVLTCAQFDARGNPLNRSPFFDHLEKIFPTIKLEDWQPPASFDAPEHLNEIIVPAVQLLVGQVARCAPLELPRLAPALTKARQITAAACDRLTPTPAELLHGRELATSVSALENFAACPFKFFVSHGLRAEERKQFELDARERGSFQHEVLTVFHNELLAENRKWRELTSDEARARIRRVGEQLLPTYHHGLLKSDAARRFAGEMLLSSLETLVTVLVGWARDYQFDPALVETGFGLKDAPWPAWRLELDDGRALRLRGRIDRVDVWRDPASGAALAVVIDYKSSSRKPDRVKLYHGLQLQLPAYLAALEQLPEVRATLNATSLAPAGVFYVNLRGEFGSTRSRSDALTDPASALREGFQHAGRYNEQFLAKLDPRGVGEQFKTSSRSHDRVDSTAFRDLLNRAVENLRRFGNEIYSGTIAPAPFRKGSETACDYCDYAAICRFDPWIQPFRSLSQPPEPIEAASPNEVEAKPKRARKSTRTP